MEPCVFCPRPDYSDKVKLQLRFLAPSARIAEVAKR